MDPDPEILIHARFGLTATFFFQKLSIYLEIGAFAFCMFFWNNSDLFIYLCCRKKIKKYLNFKKTPKSDSSSRGLPFPHSLWRWCFYRWGLGQPVLTLQLPLRLPVRTKAHNLTGSSIPINVHLLFMVIRKCPCFQTYYVCSDVRLLF